MIKKYIPELLTFRASLLSILLLILTTCGNPGYEESSDTGSLSFKLIWQDAPTLSSDSKPEDSGSMGVREASIDCTASGVSTVEASIYDSSNNLLASGGPWSCSAHSGTISNISAGTNRKAVISGKDSSGNAIYKGEDTGITITANQTTTSTITIAPSPVTFTSGLKSPLRVAVDSTNIYWTENNDSGTVKKIGINGGTVTTLASGLNYPAGIAVDSTNVYWTEENSSGTIKKVSISGGTVTTLASELSYPADIAVDSSNVYWTENNDTGTVKKVSISGGTVTTLASAQSYPYGIAVDSTSVYWATFSSGTVKKVSISGGTVTTLASGLSSPDNIAVDSTNVYWTEFTDTGAVKKVSISGGTVTTLASGLNKPWDIAIDSVNVYWTENNDTGTVKKVSISGGTVTTLASGLNYPAGIAVDSANVYWTIYSSSNGTINKIVKGETIAVASDTTAPANTTSSNFINSGSSSTTSTSVTLSISATDSVGVTAYYASETSTTPSASATGWTSVTSATSYSGSVSFTLSSGDGTKTVYVWFRDAAGNVSASASDSISLSSGDTTAPINTTGSSFIGSVITSHISGSFTTTALLSISATDSVGVTAYYITDNTTGTTPSTPSATATSGWTSVTSTTSYSNTSVSYSLSSSTVGTTVYVYVWFKDAAGNVSAVAKSSKTLTDTTAPWSPSISINSDATSTTSTSVTLTLSATDNVGVTGYYASETSTTPSASATGWTSVTSATSYSGSISFTLSSGSGTKAVYVWFKDSAGNVSSVASDSITYSTASTTLIGGSMQGNSLNLTSTNAAVTTLAGSALSSGSTNATGTSARFNQPISITTDGTNLFVADTYNHTIRKIVISTGVVTTIAGSALSSGSTDGTGTSARFYYPHGITTDGTNLFVADTYNHTIRKIVISTGVVTTIAGSAGSIGSTDGTGTSARFNLPINITTDGSNLFVADTSNNTIRKIVISTGVVTTIAGSAGSIGSTDGTGTSARFYYPYGITTDGTNLFVSDTYNYTIRKIVISTGVVTTIAGSAGSSGSTDGTGTSARFYYPRGITTDGTNLFVADTYNYTIRKIVISTGVVTTIAGTAGSYGSTDGTGTSARFYYPSGITTDGTNLFVADTNNHTIRKIAVITSLMGGAKQGNSLNLTTAVTTFAGSAGSSGTTDGTGTSARFKYPYDITTDGTNLFVADSNNHTIRKIVISTGVVTTIAGSAGSIGSTDGTGTSARFYYPYGITTDGTNLFVTDSNNHTIRKIVISTGVVTTLAGSAGLSGSTNATGTSARFYNPMGITTDGTNLFVADTYNYTIRKIVISTGVVTTIAGSAGSSGSTDGTGTSARFYNPSGITTDGTNLFVADTYNYTIRKIVISTGVVTTIAGTAGLSGSTDGTGTSARFYNPSGITTDGTNLFVADYGNYTIRKIVISTGVVTTIAGSAGSSGSTDGTGTSARFYNPSGITTDGTNLFVADLFNHTIRKIQ